MPPSHGFEDNCGGDAKTSASDTIRNFIQLDETQGANVEGVTFWSRNFGYSREALSKFNTLSAQFERSGSRLIVIPEGPHDTAAMAPFKCKGVSVETHFDARFSGGRSISGRRRCTTCWMRTSDCGFSECDGSGCGAGGGA